MSLKPKKYLSLKSGGYLEIPSGLQSFIGGSIFTVWFAFRANAAGILIDAVDSMASSGWALELTSQGAISFKIAFNGSNPNQVFDSQADGLADGSWHFVGVTFKSQLDYDLENTVQFYIDGTLYDPIVITDSPFACVLSSDAMTIGVENEELHDELRKQLACHIDDLRFFSGVNLDQAAFDGMYAAHVGTEPAETDWTGPGLYFDFDTLTGRKRDASGTWSDIENAGLCHQSGGDGGGLVLGGIPLQSRSIAAEIEIAIVDRILSLRDSGLPLFATVDVWSSQLKTNPDSGLESLTKYSPACFVKVSPDTARREGDHDLKRTFQLVIGIGIESKNEGVAKRGRLPDADTVAGNYLGTLKLCDLLIAALDNTHPGEGIASDDMHLCAEIESVDNDRQSFIQLIFEIDYMMN
jgi:hypothetical protein